MFTTVKKSLKTAVVTASAMALSTVAAHAQTTPAPTATVSDIETPGGFFTDFGVLINTALRIVLALAALLVFAYLIWGGIEWITSGGDKGKTESARNKITAAIIGLVVLAASYAILLLVLNFIGADDLNTLIEDAQT